MRGAEEQYRGDDLVFVVVRELLEVGKWMNVGTAPAIRSLDGLVGLETSDEVSNCGGICDFLKALRKLVFVPAIGKWTRHGIAGCA